MGSFIVAVIAVAILAIIFSGVAIVDAKNKKDVQRWDLSVLDSDYTSRIILFSKSENGLRLHQIITDKYNEIKFIEKNPQLSTIEKNSFKQNKLDELDEEIKSAIKSHYVGQSEELWMWAIYEFDSGEIKLFHIGKNKDSEIPAQLIEFLRYVEVPNARGNNLYITIKKVNDIDYRIDDVIDLEKVRTLESQRNAYRATQGK